MLEVSMSVGSTVLTVLLASVWFVCGLAAPAQAAETEPPRFAKHFMLLDLKARSAPVGLMAEGSLIARTTRSAPDSLLLDQTYREIGIDFVVSPAIAEAGLHAEWMPLRIFRLRAEAHALSSFGVLGYTLSFPTADAAYSDKVADDRVEESEAGVGMRLSLQPTLQIKLGPVIARHTTSVFWHALGGFKGPFVHERLYDQLQRTEGDGMMVHTSLLAYQLWDGAGDAMALAGGFHEYVESFESGTSRQRVGAVAVVIPAQTVAGFQRPRLYVQGGTNLSDRNREGDLFVQGGLGVDLWFAEQD
jgi:hypothetical protein